MLNNPDQLSVLGRVAVIDDDGAVRRSVGAILEREGYNVQVYQSASAFLEDLPSPLPGVLLLDMRMHGMTGIELQNHLQDLGSNTPVIFMSGDSRPDEIITAMKQEAFDFLLKPFTAQALLATVAHAMDAAQHKLREADQKQKVTQQLQHLTPRELEIGWCVAIPTSKSLLSMVPPLPPSNYTAPM